jgi:predicted RNA-binding protein with PIN domain
VGRIHDFFAVALAEQGWALRKSAVGLFQGVDQTGTAVARFTDDRKRAMATDGLGLLRLDHRLVASQLAKWRRTPPKRLSSSERHTGD